MIGTQYSKYSGSSGYTLGVFMTLHSNDGFSLGHPSRNRSFEIVSDEVLERFTLHLAPAFTNVGFHEIENENRYNNYYIDLNALVYFQPIRFSQELQLFVGAKPSYLVDHQSEILENGNYLRTNYALNHNRNGRIDMGLSAGISIGLSEAISLEVAYVHSFSDANTGTIVNGRSSTLEFSLKLNAQGLKNQLSRRESALKERLAGYNKGSLLVMLTSPRAKEVERLRKEGGKFMAENWVNDMEKRNLRIMKDFKVNYDFSKLYFFMDTNAYKVINKQTKGVFLNSELQPDTSISLDTGAFFVAGILEDISTYTRRHQFGLFVYDNQINQLGKPFNVPGNLLGSGIAGDPANYFRIKRVTHSNMTFEKVIFKFNSRLHQFK